MAKKDPSPPKDSLLKEIESELQKERWLRLWKRYQKPILYTASAVIIVFAGGISYSNYRTTQLESWGDSYSAALDSIDEGGQRRAITQLQRLQNESGGYYEDLAQLQEAALRSREGETERAAVIYESLQLYSSSNLVRELATILWAYIRLDDEEPTQLRSRLQSFMNEDSPWHATALELEAFILLKEDKKEEATEIFKQVALNPTTPQGLRGRAHDMLAWLGSPLPIEKNSSP